jgi:hypothetical protein
MPSRYTSTCYFGRASRTTDLNDKSLTPRSKALFVNLRGSKTLNDAKASPHCRIERVIIFDRFRTSSPKFQ